MSNIKNVTINNYILFESITFENTENKKANIIAFGSRFAYILKKIQTIGHALSRGCFFKDKLKSIDLKDQRRYMYKNTLTKIAKELLPATNFGIADLFENCK